MQKFEAHTTMNELLSNNGLPKSISYQETKATYCKEVSLHHKMKR